MTYSLAKLRAIIPDLEPWTGGERRDLDAKIAEACGWKVQHHLCATPDGELSNLPHYLGTDPSIATEAMQKLVRESGFRWGRVVAPNQRVQFGCWLPDKMSEPEWPYSLPLAWACAVIAKEDGK